jgi:hypothetical protein
MADEDDEKTEPKRYVLEVQDVVIRGTTKLETEESASEEKDGEDSIRRGS